MIGNMNTIGHTYGEWYSNDYTEKEAVKKYWYFITIHECPVCGRSSESRERRYTKKPKHGKHRYKFTHDPCFGCMG